VPQGELVALGALSLASLQLGQVPGTAWLLLTVSVLVVLADAYSAWAERSAAVALRSLGWNLLLPVFIVGAVVLLAPHKPPLWLQMLLTVGLVVPLGPMIYRLAFQPISNASTLVLMIVAIAVHFVLVGLGLVFFGAEGSDIGPIVDAQFRVKPRSTVCLWEKALRNVQYTGGLIWTELTRETLDRCGADASEAEGIVNFLVGTEGSGAAALLYANDKGWRVSLRSLPDGVDVAAIAAEFGGGGHPRAAGAQIEGGEDGKRAFVERVGQLAQEHH